MVMKATTIAVSTRSAVPLSGIIEIDCGNTIATFEINEDLALRLCADLERFLTQAPRRPRARGFG